MLRLPMCINCGDPAVPNAWMCTVCEGLQERAKKEALKTQQYAHQVTAAVYAALAEYREQKHSRPILAPHPARERRAAGSSR